MTVKELSQLYYLNREIERDTERLERLRSSLSAPGASAYDGMPINPILENHFERRIAEIVDLEATIQAKITQCLHERNRLERYISDIPDSMMRQIFTLRFINRLTWRMVAFSIGGGNSEESVKKACYRYISKEESEKP